MDTADSNAKIPFNDPSRGPQEVSNCVSNPSKRRIRDHVRERVIPFLVDHAHEGMELPMQVVRINPVEAFVAIPAMEIEVVLLHPLVDQFPFTAVPAPPVSWVTVRHA